MFIPVHYLHYETQASRQKDAVQQFLLAMVPIRAYWAIVDSRGGLFRV